MAGMDSQNRTDPPSVPLYLAGLIITFCGILGANAALSTADYAWMLKSLLVTGLGFLVSFGSRRLEIAPRLLDFVFAAFAALLLLAVMTGNLEIERFLPVGADNNNMRLLAGLAWLSTLWSWNLRSDNRVMGTTVPAMAALGLAATIDLNDPVLICFGLFILTVIFLLIHQNYLQNRARAVRREWEKAASRLLAAQVAQTGLCALLVLLAGIVVIIPAQAVFAHLSLAQAIRQLAAIGQHGPLGGSGNAALHFSDDENLQIGTGDAWSASAEVVMRVTPSDGQEHYWRGRTYDRYMGDGWQSSLEYLKQAAGEGLSDGEGATQVSYALPATITPGDLAAPQTEPTVNATFRVLGDTSQFYYAANPQQILLDIRRSRSDGAPQVCADGRLDLTTNNSVRFSYTIVSKPAPDAMQQAVQERLRRAGTKYPANVRRLYLNLDNDITQPDDVAFYHQAVSQALQGLPTGERDPLDKTLALRAWVANRCVYSLAVPKLPDEADHVHAFLGDTRRGYCDMFASSLAVLCRAAGIPARLATGFAPGDPDGDSFNLRGEDKHAWTEVYFPKTGWVAFDATAGTKTDGSVPTASAQSGGSWLSRLHFSLGYGWEFIWPLLGVITLIGAYVLKTEVYDRWRRGAAARGDRAETPRTALGRQYRRMTRVLARLGLPRRLSETPGEYAARAAPFLAGREQELGVSLSPSLVTNLTRAFTLACYAPSSAGSQHPDTWEREVAQFDAAAWAAQWRRLWRR